MPIKDFVQNIGRAIGGAVSRGVQGIKRIGTTIGKHAMPVIKKVGQYAVPAAKYIANWVSDMPGITGAIASGIKGLISTGEDIIGKIPDGKFKTKAREIFEGDGRDGKELFSDQKR